MSFGKFTQKEILDLVSASWAPYWGTGGGGSGTPGSPTDSIQYNSAGAFAGSSSFTYIPPNLYFTGSFFISGAISASYGPNTIGFFGTSSWAVSASRAITSSYVTGSIFTSANPVLSASYALTSSFSISSSYASFASTASYISSTSALPPGTYNITASWALNAITSSYALTASYALNSGEQIWVRSSGDNSAVLNDLSGRISSAQGSSSIAYGYTNTASGDFSQAQGYNTIAIGKTAHSEGANTIARGATSHVEGFDNIAGSNISRKNYHVNDIQYSTIPSGSGTLYYDAVNSLGTLTFVLAVDDPNSSLHNLVFMPVFWSGSVSGSGGVNTNVYASQSLAIYDGTTRQLVKHVDLSSWYDPVLTKASLSGSDAYQQNITYMWHNPIQDRVYVMFTNFGGNGVSYGIEKGVFWLSGSYDGINPPDIYIHNTSSFSDGWHNVYFWTGSVATETAWTGSAPSEQYLNGVLREYPPWPGYLGIHPALENQPTFNKINGKHYVLGNRVVGGGNQPLSGIAIINGDFQLEYTGSITAAGITNNTIVDFAIQGQFPLGKGFRTPISGCAFPGYQSGYFNNKGAVDSRGNVWFGTYNKTAGNPVDLICLYATGSVSSSNAQLFKHTINYLNEGTCSRHIAGPIYYPGDGTPNSERIIVVAAFTGSRTYNSINFPGSIPYQNGLSNAHMRWLAYDIDGNLKENPWNQFKWGNADVNLSDQGEALYNRYTFTSAQGGDIDGNTVYWWEKEKAFVTRFNYYRPLPNGSIEQPGGTLILINPQGAVIDGLRYEKVVDNVNSVFVDNNFPNGPILRYPWGGANGFFTPNVHNIQITNNGESLVLQLGHYLFGSAPTPGYIAFYTQSFVWVDPVVTPYTSSGAGAYEFGQYAHAEGITTTARGYGSHTEGHYTVTSGAFSHAEGFQSRAKGESSHAEGWYTLSSGSYSHAEGLETYAEGDGSHAEGYFTFARGRGSHAEGVVVAANGLYSHAEGGYTTAVGLGSHAEGQNTYAVGSYSHAEGYTTYVDGQFAHAEGINTRAIGAGAHAEGESTNYNAYYAQGRASHVEGYNTKTLTAGAFGHAEGELTTVSGRGAHAEGYGGTAAASHSHAEGSGTNVTTGGVAGHAEGNQTYVQAPWAHAEGFSSNAQSTASHAEGAYTETKVGSDYSHAEGYYTDTYAPYSHTEGEETKTYGTSSHAEGYQTETYGYASHAEGYQAKSYGDYSHVEGYQTKTSGSYSHAEGYQSIASASYSHAEGQSITRADASHAEGYLTTTYGVFSHTEGQETSTSGSYSHAEGYGTKTTGSWSHAEGQTTIASGSYSHAEGINSIAIGQNSHAEGNDTKAYGNNSHAEGYQAKSYGASSHAEGFGSNAIGPYSHAEGINTNAVGLYSHAEGINTKASASYSHAEGYQSIAGQVGTVYVPESPEVIITSSYVDSTITIVQDTFYLANNANIVQTTDATWYFVWFNSYNQGTPGTMQVIVNGTDPQETYTVYDVYFDGTYYNLIASTGLTNTGFTSATISNTYTPGYSLDYWAAYAPGFSYDTLRGQGSHAEGINTIAEGDFSHAEGYNTRTIGDYSHAGGIGTIASGSNGQTVIGRYNLKNNTSDLFTIGDGTDDNNRHDLVNAGIGYVNITGSLGLSGSLNFTGNMLISGSLTVIGVNITSGSVDITGSFTSNGNNTLLGTTLISGSQNIVGPTNITGSLIVSNSFTVIGTNTTSGSVYITGSSTLIGNSTITGSILMTGSAAISSINYIDFVTTANPTHNEGRVHWLDDTKTLQVDTEVSNFNIELGHQSIVRVYNPNSYTMTPGMVVFISGSQGNRPSITTASWEGDPSSAGTIGFVATTIGSSGNGYVVTNGLLRNVNTNAFNVGDRLFLSSSGQFTNTPPDAPLHEVRLGNVIVQNATTGVIYVGVMNGYELTELHDVKTTTYADGDLLVQSSSLWINSKQLTGSYGLTGSLSFTNGGVTGSLYGTASWSTNALTASYVNTLYQDVVVVGNITAQQYIVSSSVLYITQSNYSGSTIFGNSLDDTHQFTGSIYYTGSITGIGRAIFNDLSATGSLSGSFFGIASGSILNGISFWGTSSWAASASVAISSSWTQPGGPYTSIQFNDSNVLSGSNNFTFDKNTNTVNLTGSLYVTGSTAISGTLDIISNVATQLQPAVKVNTSGVLSFGSQSLEPTVVVGGIYFDGNDFYLGFP